MRCTRRAVNAVNAGMLACARVRLAAGTGHKCGQRSACMRNAPCRTCAAAGAASSVRAAGGRMWPEVLHERSSACAFSAHVRAEMHRSLPPRQQGEAPGGCWLRRARCCVARLFSMHAAVTRAPMGSPSLFGTVRVHIGYACAACFCGWTVSVSIL